MPCALTHAQLILHTSMWNIIFTPLFLSIFLCISLHFLITCDKRDHNFIVKLTIHNKLKKEDCGTSNRVPTKPGRWTGLDYGPDRQHYN